MSMLQVLAVSLVLVAGGLAGKAATPSPYEGGNVMARTNPIDTLVFARLDRLGIAPANLCSDAVFVRRAYLDTIGTLPTATEAREFILDPKPDKRHALIDRLLARNEFADYWTMKWCDLLRVKAEFPINLWPNAAQAYHRWIRTALRDNKPYDQFARELLTSSGSNFRVGPVNFYRAMQNRDPQGIAQSVALTFLGARADQWPTNERAGLAAFFSQVGFKDTSEWKEEIVFWNPAATNAQTVGMFPGGKQIRFAGDRDPREVFADWLIDAKNPWFARSLVNRVWAWLLGRGIIHEPDDIRADNPPSNPELLALLEREFVASKYDLKQLYRLILNSQTYQLAAIPQSEKPEAAAHFAAYPVRRLDAEVLIDALNQITSTTEKYSSPIPEPFTFIPEDQRSIALPDGSITSPFLEMFGRSPRDTGLASERNNRIAADQRLHLLNSSHIQRKLEQSRMLQFQLQGNKPPREIITAMYLGILSRFPTEAEVQTAEAYAKSAASRREAVADLAWALINSTEFLYRH
jgi:hypothetical protein